MKEGNILICQKLHKYDGGETFIPLKGPIF